ncbi:methyl-accepting chemotaxis protein [Synoicihabitans lomoniglobus]
MLVMGVFAFYRIVKIEHEITSLETDSVPGLYGGAQLITNWLDMYALAERHTRAIDDAEQAQIEVRLNERVMQAEMLLTAYESTIRNETDRVLFETFEVELHTYETVQAELLRISAKHDDAATSAFVVNELEPQFIKVERAIEALMDNSKADIDASTAVISHTVVATETGLLVVMVIVLALAVFSAVSLVRAINQPLRTLLAVTEAMRQADFTQRAQLARNDEFRTLGDGFNRMADDLAALVGQVKNSVVQVNTSTTEISATAREQQATASEIAATTSEIGATSKEISATSKDLVRTMGEVSDVADQSAQLADSGQTGLAHMEETMHQVMEAAGGIKSKLAILNEKALNINQVVTTITKVADQTNLLSLNAAIEAEKAGEYGRGFAVVATEIRRLADQTAIATYDIEQMVKEMQSAVSAGVMGMDKFSEEVRRGMDDVQQVGGQLAQIIQQVQALAPRVEAVNEGMQAQSTGAEQISQALEQLSEAAQQTVDSLRQSGEAIDGLNTVSRDLRDGVSRFKLSPAATSGKPAGR